MIERWRDVDRDRDHYRVNGAVEAVIDGNEVRSVEAYERLVLGRVTGLVWLAMPVHDASTSAPNRPGASAASGDPVARETTPPSPASEQARKTP